MAENGAAPPSTRKPHKVGWAEAARDFLIFCAGKGQLPLGGVIVIVLAIVGRASTEAVDALLSSTIDGFRHGWLVGYGLALVFIVCWTIHIGWTNKIKDAEIDRISKERDAAQKDSMDADIQSSE